MSNISALVISASIIISTIIYVNCTRYQPVDIAGFPLGGFDRIAGDYYFFDSTDERYIYWLDMKGELAESKG